ncbi:MAG: hypothetical protein ACYTGC_03680, partial [Planctomycetota bacterium]
MRFRSSFPVAAALCLVLGLITAWVAARPLADTEGRAAPWPTQRWPVSPPSEQGLDTDRLDELVV